MSWTSEKALFNEDGIRRSSHHSFAKSARLGSYQSGEWSHLDELINNTSLKVRSNQILEDVMILILHPIEVFQFIYI